MQLLVSKRSIMLYISIIFINILISGCSKETIVERIEEEDKDKVNLNSLDMLTPAYYKSNTDTSFIVKINQFLNLVQQEQFHHPLKSLSGEIPSYEIHRKFGDGIGPGGTAQYHPAADLHVGNKETGVYMYAAHDGYVTTVKNANKYRHYVSITKDIVDADGELTGKLVTLYAHVDLDLDEAESLNMNGKQVNKGDVISRHLYSGTLGGPHLHFEIRYYRKTDAGDETFYGYGNPDLPELKEPSAGKWLYGVWNPDVGYGFGNPLSHGLDF